MVVARNVVIDLNTGPAWSPDSRKIFYVKKDPKSFNQFMDTIFLPVVNTFSKPIQK